jgi:transposase
LAKPGAQRRQIDAELIARFVLTGDARPAYVPNELITTYRELIRLHTNLADEATRYKNELRTMLEVLFGEFTQVFADPRPPRPWLYSNVIQVLRRLLPPG